MLQLGRASWVIQGPCCHTLPCTLWLPPWGSPGSIFLLVALRSSAAQYTPSPSRTSISGLGCSSSTMGANCPVQLRHISEGTQGHLPVKGAGHWAKFLCLLPVGSSAAPASQQGTQNRLQLQQLHVRTYRVGLSLAPLPKYNFQWKDLNS